ncbi:MAG TPA: hypothetical protein VL137_01925 [Polyangiaceae bacterium]|nr:hypothetical protein [Polyangiaceae bacterium]
MVRHFLNRFRCAHVALATGLFTLPAQAGIAECNDLRLEDVSQCELQGDLSCSASCNELGVYKKACATKLTTVCQQQCTLDATPTCTDSCTEQCSSQCDLGVNVICSHNCFGECAKNCDFDCELSDNIEQCHASCEANCDNECDIKCKPLVEGSCYQHCIECCGGSCKAQANMECQTTCQQQQFESCEYQFQADCQASCTGDGSLFCDGEYVLSGSQIPSCTEALVKRGVQGLHLETTGQLDVHGSQATAAGKARASCNFAPTPAPQPFGVGMISCALTAALGLCFRGRRKGC